MSSLGVHGDPGGWQHAGSTLSVAASQLTAELQAADATGGSGLGSGWHGPVSEAYQATWRAHHGHYADFIYQVGRAADALTDFGERLADLQVRAARLEAHWLSAGLHLSADGLQFTLPHNYASVAQDALATLRGLVTESAGDVEAMWHDIAEATADLVTVLASVIDAVQDFQALSWTAVTTSLGWAFDKTVEQWKQPWGPAGDLLAKESKTFLIVAQHADDVAHKLNDEWSKDTDPDIRAAGQALSDDADADLKSAKAFDGVAKAGGDVLTAVTMAYTVGETVSTAHKVGWINSIEDHSDDWTSLGVGLGVGAATDALMGTALVGGAVLASPILVPAAIIVVGGLVSVGIGAVVKHEVKDHRAGTTRGLSDIGTGIKDASVWTANQTGLIPAPAS